MSNENSLPELEGPALHSLYTVHSWHAVEDLLGELEKIGAEELQGKVFELWAAAYRAGRKEKLASDFHKVVFATTGRKIS